MLFFSLPILSEIKTHIWFGWNDLSGVSRRAASSVTIEPNDAGWCCLESL